MPSFSARQAGIYRCTFKGTEEKLMTDKETGVEEARWIWKFQEVSDPTSAGQIDKITGTSLQSGNSNAHKIAAGLMGRKLADGDDTDSRIGQLFDVVYGPNQAGTLTITGVMPVTAAAPQPMSVPEPLSAAENAGESIAPLAGDLPF